MARVLVVYHKAPLVKWLSTYVHNLESLTSYPGHEVFYLNTARSRAPGYMAKLEPDLIIYHYTFLAARLNQEEFEREMRLIDFTKDIDCRKALVAQDEQARSDLICEIVNRFGVRYIFTPASEPDWRQIYEGIDFDRTIFHTILTGYVDDTTVKWAEKRAERHVGRPIDIGYRSWYMQPFYGRHGQLKRQIAGEFKDNAPRFDLLTDISTDSSDALWGDKWFDFLLDCKYTIGVEGGSSVFDRDGSVARCTFEYRRLHPDATFDEFEAACFPGLDGKFGYHLMGPRHLEAIMMRTCQALIEGHYGGALEPGKHYIEIKRDFSNLDEVLQSMKDDKLREAMVERAYQDVIASEKWSYRAYADLVYSESLKGVGPASLHEPTFGSRMLLVWNRVGDRAWQVPRVIRDGSRNAAVRVVGEEPLWRALVRSHNVVRRLTGREPLSLDYFPTEAELERRRKKAAK